VAQTASYIKDFLSANDLSESSSYALAIWLKYFADEAFEKFIRISLASSF
jgi:hypothetical protein